MESPLKTANTFKIPVFTRSLALLLVPPFKKKSIFLLQGNTIFYATVHGSRYVSLTVKFALSESNHPTAKKQ